MKEGCGCYWCITATNLLHTTYVKMGKELGAIHKLCYLLKVEGVKKRTEEKGGGGGGGGCFHQKILDDYDKGEISISL